MTRIYIPLNEKICATCDRAFVPFHKDQDWSASQRVRSKGHLIPVRLSNGMPAARPWVFQCVECNKLQKDMTIREWYDALVEAGAHHARQRSIERLLDRVEKDYRYRRFDPRWLKTTSKHCETASG